MDGVQLLNNTTTRCLKLIGNSKINLDWTSLIWLGLLIIVFELVIYTVIRLKNIYIPPRFMIAVMVLSAIILAEALPWLFLQLAHSC